MIDELDIHTITEAIRADDYCDIKVGVHDVRITPYRNTDHEIAGADIEPDSSTMDIDELSKYAELVNAVAIHLAFARQDEADEKGFSQDDEAIADHMSRTGSAL